MSFLAAKNPGLPADVSATISGNEISATVPFGTDVSALVASFETTGSSVTVDGVAQVSGMTPNNFSFDVIYRVSAADGTIRAYTVTVKSAPSTAKQITALAFLAAKNAGLPADVTATINGTAIAATVPFGTNVTALVATFTTTGTKVTIGSTTQTSGTTANDFTSPVTYRVTAADGSTKDYVVTVTVALNSAKALTAFSFQSANNPVLGADITATINGLAIAATVPFGTDVTGLVATFSTTGASVKVGAIAQTSATTANNFTAPVAYTVTAADGTTAVYTVTVTVALNPAKAITAYAFTSAKNSGLPADVTATINGLAIAATVPFGTDVTALVATFSTTGASVTVGGTTQTSGTTANDFTSPVTYTVTAADGTTAVYTVTVTVASNTAKAITKYAFLSADNPGLPATVTATINGTAIAATVPFGTDPTALVATFTTTGASVAVGGTTQTSGMTVNDFTSSVTYTVTAADGSTQDFTVTVTVALNPAKAITAYSFASANNPVLSADVTATINGLAITATVPFGTNVTALVATFTTTGASVTVGGTTQTSDMTANDFSAPVAYTVTAADGTTNVYTVTVTVALNPAKDITAFAFLSADNAALPADVSATITGTSIAATVPFGTNVTGLIATFSITGASVTVAGTTQASGITPNDFTTPVTYQVTAADGTTQDYTVTVAIAPNPAKDITAYAFLSADNPGLTQNVSATITGTSIAATVPFGTNVTALVATFSTTGANVTVGSTAQVSGMTPNDFSSPVAYTVTAADGSTAVFTVTVTVAPAPKDITAFSFLTAKNAGLTTNVIATITGTSITAIVPPTTNVTALVASFTTTGASVAVGGTTQVSGTTPNNFTAPVTYRVTAVDGSTQDFTVTVTVAIVITNFSFTGANGNEATFPADSATAGLASVPIMSRVGGTATMATNAFSGSGWNTSAINTAHYYSFTVTPAAGVTMTLANLSLKDQRSSTGPTTFTIRSSRDNFAADLQTFSTHASLNSSSLPLGVAFASLTTAVEFRIYAFGASASTGTWRIDDVQLTGLLTP